MAEAFKVAEPELTGAASSAFHEILFRTTDALALIGQLEIIGLDLVEAANDISRADVSDLIKSKAVQAEIKASALLHLVSIAKREIRQTGSMADAAATAAARVDRSANISVGG